MTIRTLLESGEIDSTWVDQFVQDDRAGYSGYILESKTLTNVFRFLKDNHGFDYLSSITAVDYLDQGLFELVYHLYRSSGGDGIILKTRIHRMDPVVPSLTPLYPGADFQEREVWDLFGIRFSGHPDLRRILLWEGFQGHPLRKDWQEPFYEEDVKPFRSRWPEGHFSRNEDRNTYGNNVQYPEGFDPESSSVSVDESLYQDLLKDRNSESSLSTEQLVVNLGPQHPSTHGVFRMVVSLDGEKIVGLKPVMGYLHRDHEKIGERNTFLQNMPFTDRLDYISSMSNNFGYALAVEKLMGIAPPERAEYIRVIMAELTRIVSHLIANGFLLNDLGAFFTPALYAIEERELIVDIFEEVSGSRMMCNYLRFGGVVRDVNDDMLMRIKKLVTDRLPRKLDDLDRYITHNDLVKLRSQGVGILSPERAIACSATGPLLRASGVPYDIRKVEPYGIYDRFNFDVVYGTHGDVYDRYLVRMEEMRQSLRILEQAIKQIPPGPVMTGKPQFQVRVPPGESYMRIESPKGELGFYIVSNGKPNPWRYHVRAPSFINLTSLEAMCLDQKVADVVVIFGSIDIVLGEVDR